VLLNSDVFKLLLNVIGVVPLVIIRCVEHSVFVLAMVLTEVGVHLGSKFEKVLVLLSSFMLFENSSLSHGLVSLFSFFDLFLSF